jgi:hypothetical protein
VRSGCSLLSSASAILISTLPQSSSSLASVALDILILITDAKLKYCRHHLENLKEKQHLENENQSVNENVHHAKMLNNYE